MNKFQILHNPACSKSRQTLEILSTEGKETEIINYLKTPPSFEQLKNILTMLNLTPSELMRKGESKYKELDLKNTTCSDDELINIMLENPILIERPIVIAAGKAIIGRPPETVKSIF
ncbi:Uncharacterized protein YfgD, not an arsenate reductase [hydrothermal vent metagenome]|uniref:Uncharacterized protein YfgD, not an arsenate reductase n=1 Tax=hydrothermal vent metagenome TaxID=652676 RepID=A0A3B0Y991_9ZZZZ